MGTSEKPGSKPSNIDPSEPPGRPALVALLTYVWALSLKAEEAQRTVPHDLVVEIAETLLVLATAGELSWLPGDPAERLRVWLASTRTPHN